MKWKGKGDKGKSKQIANFIHRYSRYRYRYSKWRLTETKIRFHRFRNIIIAETISRFLREEKFPGLSYMTAPRPTLCHLWEDSLTHQMLITACSWLIGAEGHREFRMSAGSRNPAGFNSGIDSNREPSDSELMRYPTLPLSHVLNKLRKWALNEEIHLNLLNLFQFLIFTGVPLIILIDCTFFFCRHS